MRIILNENGEGSLASALLFLQLSSFIYLIIVTIGVKWWMIRLNKKMLKEEKVYSNFSLMIKNIPKFYQLSDIIK